MIARRVGAVLRRLATLLAVASMAGIAGPAHAGGASSRFCDRAATVDAAQQDRILRFAAIVKEQLDASGHGVALISRSGLDLQRFGVRYSHAGFSLKASRNTPWSVRQLYFACDEQRPRIFDQGISGFLIDVDDPDLAYVSLVFLPAEAQAAVERAALDDRQALRLLGARYSANAYPFSTAYQNCNQWLIEMLAAAWGLPGEHEHLRPRAQAWLQAQGYRPTRFEQVFPPPILLGSVVSLLHGDDHPPDDLDQRRIQVSLPAAIEAFVAARLPQATRIELCHTARHVVIHRGWQPIAPGCEPGPGDQVVSLLDPAG